MVSTMLCSVPRVKKKNQIFFLATKCVSLAEITDLYWELNYKLIPHM